eukprot:2403694-Prymnesium_polylepis.1
MTRAPMTPTMPRKVKNGIPSLSTGGSPSNQSTKSAAFSMSAAGVCAAENTSQSGLPLLSGARADTTRAPARIPGSRDKQRCALAREEATHLRERLRIARQHARVLAYDARGALLAEDADQRRVSADDRLGGVDVGKDDLLVAPDRRQRVVAAAVDAHHGLPDVCELLLGARDKRLAAARRTLVRWLEDARHFRRQLLAKLHQRSGAPRGHHKPRERRDERGQRSHEQGGGHWTRCRSCALGDAQTPSYQYPSYAAAESVRCRVPFTASFPSTR